VCQWWVYMQFSVVIKRPGRMSRAWWRHDKYTLIYHTIKLTNLTTVAYRSCHSSHYPSGVICFPYANNWTASPEFITAGDSGAVQNRNCWNWSMALLISMRVYKPKSSWHETNMSEDCVCCHCIANPVKTLLCAFLPQVLYVMFCLQNGQQYL